MVESIQLTGEMIAVMAILAFTMYLFAFEVVRVDVAAISVMVLLGLTSLIPGYDGLVAPEHLHNKALDVARIKVARAQLLGWDARLHAVDAVDALLVRHLQRAHQGRLARLGDVERELQRERALAHRGARSEDDELPRPQPEELGVEVMDEDAWLALIAG